MMQEELESLENSLRRLPTASVPPELLARLRAAKIERQLPSISPPRRIWHWPEWFAGWRWLALAGPATAVLLMHLAPHPAAVPDKKQTVHSTGIKASSVQVDHALVSSFDAVAQLPGGEPVRFRCREWQDNVVLHDDANGLVIAHHTPRVEVVPVRFETY